MKGFKCMGWMVGCVDGRGGGGAGRGPLMGGGGACCLSNLRNPLVLSHYICHFPVNLKKSQCCMSDLRTTLYHVGYIFLMFKPHVACRF